MLDSLNATYTAPRQSNKSRPRGYLGHKRPTCERADLAARAYAQRRPIEAPTLQQLAFAYRVSVASIQRVLNGKPKPLSLAEHLINSTPAERAEAARALGVDKVWDSMVAPLVGAAAE